MAKRERMAGLQRTLTHTVIDVHTGVGLNRRLRRAAKYGFKGDIPEHDRVMVREAVAANPKKAGTGHE